MTLRRIFSLASMALALVFTAASAENLVILHTNDTHSQIDPADNGLGGIMRRKALIDSVRFAQDNVLLVDAGDAVQGTLFFTLYGGEVEHKAMNVLGYDLAILGNHDFDNGVRELAKNLSLSNATWLTTNYDIKDSSLEGKLVPYSIKEYGGRRIGFMGINLEPRGMIAEGNYNGVKYLDAYKAANATAWALKHNEKCDLVVAITHIGYDGQPGPRDISLVRQSEDIDIIIGGHSHTTIIPDGQAEYVENAIGRPVLVVQTGSRGAMLGELTIDLDALTSTARLIPVDSRLDVYSDEVLQAALRPYRVAVDSIMNLKVATSSVELTAPRLLNLFSDYVKQIGQGLTDAPVDLAIINKGGIRRTLPKGNVTEGMVIMTLPFNNRVQVLEIKGSDLADALDVMARRSGDGVSSDVRAIYDPATGRCTEVTVNGAPLDPDRTYRLATIDYLARGGDYMFPLTKGRVTATSRDILYTDILDILKSTRKKLAPSDTPRMVAIHNDK